MVSEYEGYHHLLIPAHRSPTCTCPTPLPYFPSPTVPSSRHFMNPTMYGLTKIRHHATDVSSSRNYKICQSGGDLRKIAVKDNDKKDVREDQLLLTLTGSDNLWLDTDQSPDCPSPHRRSCCTSPMNHCPLPDTEGRWSVCSLSEPSTRV
ncbi:hypothetical protein E2C01_082780 [Portunus trituberculatus]|uniref:Uncharacterized protein n=1 Tax=Portunus trituberculatus TaxID=210409 RepID=A0A5B7IT84_PORTR|nr:hypothetical protein [Portunus trituberculatus]